MVINSFLKFDQNSKEIQRKDYVRGGSTNKKIFGWAHSDTPSQGRGLRYSDAGFTLIETIIAVFVLAVGIVAVLYMFPMGTHVAKSGQMVTIATQLGQARMEEEISKPYDEIAIATITENYGNITNFSTYQRVIEINCVRAADLSVRDCTYDPTNDPDPIKKIEVTVYWRSPLGVAEKNINLVSLIAKR